jgi:hypothetical protein
MRLVRTFPAVLLMMVLVLTAGGCTKKMREAFRGMFALRTAIQKEYNVQNVSIGMMTDNGGTTLTVSFVNSAFNDLSEQERSQKAQEVADFVSRTYSDYRSLSHIKVAFVVKKDHFLVHVSKTVGVYSFDVPKTVVPKAKAPKTATETI